MNGLIFRPHFVRLRFLSLPNQYLPRPVKYFNREQRPVFMDTFRVTNGNEVN